MEDKIKLEFTETEYLYLSNVLDNIFDYMKKLPKNTGTDKFFIMENLVLNQFNTKNYLN